jgi:predicted membrane-bound spermidine synthase
MIRFAALLLTVCTGFAGLVYEVAWQKYLAALLGSHAEATAAVLAIFLGGLSVGYALFGRATSWIVERARNRAERPRLLYFYALIEAGIGLYALLFPTLFGVARHVSLLGPSSEGVGFAFDVVLSGLLIGPPAVLMGGTIPVLTLALAGNLEHATRVHAWVYGFNTLGAFAGALAAAFVLIPWLGLDGAVFAMGSVNLAAAAVFAALDLRAASVAPDLAEPPLAEPVSHFLAWASIALLAGFAMMALQTTLNRIGALAFGSSQFTFAMVVAVFVLCIALGSLAVSALGRVRSGLVVSSQWALLLLLFPLYLGISDAGYWAHTIRVLFGRADPAFYAYQYVVFCAVLALLAVPIGLSGALLPLLFNELRGEVRDLGGVAGRLYAWNTVGSLLGALLGGYVLLFWLDLHQVYRIAMAAVAVAAALLTLLVLRSSLRLIPALILLPTLVAIWLLPPWSAERLTAGLFRTRQPTVDSFEGPDRFFEKHSHGEVIFYDDDPTSTVSALVPPAGLENLAIVVNGKSDGALRGDYGTMALSALVPALMAENHERAFVIGLGTGVTAGELAALDGTRTVEVAEISRGVIAANPLFDPGAHYDPGYLSASKNPKVEMRRGDAFRSLLRTEGRYDVIVSEPSNPWVTGVEMLYSREFLEAARSRLAPGGVYGQWFHLYESDVEIVELVLRTYASVFPHVSVWFAQGVDLLLLGFDRPARALDVHALAERFQRPDFRAGFARVRIESFPQLLSHELLPLGTLHAEALEGELHTLNHPILSYKAARAFFRGQGATLPRYMSARQARVSARNSLLRRYAGGGGSIPQEILEAAASETCRLGRIPDCGTLLARWATDHPNSQRFQAVLTELWQAQGAGANSLIAPAHIGRLQVLFSAQLSEVDPKMALKRAESVTNRFVNNYHHAVPFNSRVLDVAWRACWEEECEERRRAAMRGFVTTQDGSVDRSTAAVNQHSLLTPTEAPAEPETLSRQQPTDSAD